MLYLCDEVHAERVTIVQANNHYKLLIDNEPLLVQTPDLVVWDYRVGVLTVCIEDDDPFMRMLERLRPKLEAIGVYAHATMPAPIDHTFKLLNFFCQHSPNGMVMIKAMDVFGQSIDPVFKKGTRAIFVCRLDHVAKVGADVKLRIEAITTHMR